MFGADGGDREDKIRAEAEDYEADQRVEQGLPPVPPRTQCRSCLTPFPTRFGVNSDGICKKCVAAHDGRYDDLLELIA